MTNIDSAEEIKALDKSNLLGSILALPDQMEDTWNKMVINDIPTECSLCKNVVVSGMGGSALGGRIVDSLITDRARTPIEVFTEFKLPNYVNKDTLVILSSYSGNTEETLSAGHEALNRGATIFGIATGGKLKEFLEVNNLKNFIINPQFNPSNQPRMGLGYSIAAVLAILARCEFINLLDTEVKDAISVTRDFLNEFGVENPTTENIAKSISLKFKNKIPVLFASEHLLGIAHAFKNQLNENSKAFSLLFDIPEANHHLMEGLRNPAEAKSFYHFLFLESELYSKEVQKRYPITKEVVEKNEVSISSYNLRSKKKLNQIFEILALGSFVSFYLAMLYDLDPTPIPWVDYFKEKLAQ
ncbi:MAG: bifunctional phosphoglucose/phosphomannose isomerase [Patescibacteria group bacterium]